MNAIAKAGPAISAEALEHVLGTGDLAKLTTQQRVEYYGQVCRSVGINPLTRPFRFMSFQGQTVLYATRDCTDQLRNLRKINITIADKQLDGDLFIVTARATTPDGRTDEDVGAVTLGKLQGDARANQIMKALTKAKRRVTMSICGLGFLDESEVETLQGAATFDAEAEPPVARMPHNSPAIQDQPKRTWRGLIDETAGMLAACVDLDAVVAVGELPAVLRALDSGPKPVKDEMNALLAAAFARHRTDPDPKLAEAIAADDAFPGDR